MSPNAKARIREGVIVGVVVLFASAGLALVTGALATSRDVEALRAERKFVVDSVRFEHRVDIQAIDATLNRVLIAVCYNKNPLPPGCP